MANYNLWLEPWIKAENHDGSVCDVNLVTLLQRAASFHDIVDSSPLIVVGIKRLLVAILQDIIQPKADSDLIALWQASAFPVESVARFGTQYSHRFDLFGEITPFLQSADIPLVPSRATQLKSVGVLFAEIPSGTAVTHFTHLYERAQVFCSACCAKGLTTIPPFATSGGAGNRPSINGVPPIYIVPRGNSLFSSLAASLVTPDFEPDTLDNAKDLPWWKHDGVISRSHSLGDVGYLHGLTFPARRTRLLPLVMSEPCSRCGETTKYGVARMLYEMGEFRPRTARFWRDPFVAYRVARGPGLPSPIRPVQERPFWREFDALFSPEVENGQSLRPAFLNQLVRMRHELPCNLDEQLAFQAVGMRTDLRMKVFEWACTQFQVPWRVLSEADIAHDIANGLEYASTCERILRMMFRRYFEETGNRVKGSATLRNQMIQNFWSQLAIDFDAWILRSTTYVDSNTRLQHWEQIVREKAVELFSYAVVQLDRGNASTLYCQRATLHCRNLLSKVRVQDTIREASQ